MNWAKIAQQLPVAFTEVRIQTEGGKVLTPAAPVDVQQIILQAIDSDEDLEELELTGIHEDNSAAAIEVLEAHWPFQMITSFEWESFGPMSWFASLISVDIGDGRDYVCPIIEERRLKAVAAVEPNNHSATFSAFFRSLIAANGTTYGVELFGSLPTETINWPDLISADDVFDSYWEWMNWASQHGGDSIWTDLREETIDQMVEPDHLSRSLRALKKLPRSGGVEGLAQWLKDREEEGAQLSQEDRLLTLRNYFDRAYNEVRPGKRRKRRSKIDK